MPDGTHVKTLDVSSDTADHVVEARRRARTMFAGEAHLASVDDWRRVFVSARDALILIWLTWAVLQGFGDPPLAAPMLVAMAVGLALLTGISTGRSTFTQIQVYAEELDRERREIRDNFDHECDEVRALYAAKGFREPLLGQIVETLTADDDRLLKVMMEEELGLHMHHMPHPLVVGLWNFAGTLTAGLAFALPMVRLSPGGMRVWAVVGGAALLLGVSVVAARVAHRPAVQFVAVGFIMAGVTGGVAYFLARWFSVSLAGAGIG